MSCITEPELRLNRGLGRDTNGWSCVLINTKKGKDFFDMHGSGIQKFLSKAEWIEKNNHQLRHYLYDNSKRYFLISIS